MRHVLSLNYNGAPAGLSGLIARTVTSPSHQFKQKNSHEVMSNRHFCNGSRLGRRARAPVLADEENSPHPAPDT
jgi:hypothetical protein